MCTVQCIRLQLRKTTIRTQVPHAVCFQRVVWCSAMHWVGWNWQPNDYETTASWMLMMSTNNESTEAEKDQHFPMRQLCSPAIAERAAWGSPRHTIVVVSTLTSCAVLHRTLSSNDLKYHLQSMWMSSCPIIYSNLCTLKMNYLILTQFPCVFNLIFDFSQVSPVLFYCRADLTKAHSPVERY